ncbi:MAG: hypothetical protein K2F64_02370, partial [Muribaculaceae bacterium]|nr:hypothetical protein [Muribaculaceae bacterium]
MNDFNRTPNQPDNKKVEFMIWGNPQANAGYSPIFYFNNPRFTPPADSSPGGMSDNDYYFVVNISSAFTNIVLIQNHVKSAGSSRDARLKFAMSIPKGMRLVNNKTGVVSPFDLLFKMRNMFIARYMEPIRGGVGHSFLANIPPNAAGSPELQGILESYSYRTAMLPHRPMKGNETAFLQLPVDKISEILTDLQYPEFAIFKEIVIAEKGSLSPVVGISAIPRRPNWRLVVNNTPTKLRSTDPDVDQTYSVTDKNPKYYDNTSIKFKISDVRSKGCNGVTIDEANEVIRVTITPTPKKLSYKIQVIDSSSNKEIRIPKGISFKVGNYDVYPKDGILTLQGEQIDKNITATYKGEEFTLNGCNIDKNIIRVILTPKKRVENNTYASSNIKASDKSVKIQFSIKGKDANKYAGKVIVSKRDGQG